MITDKEGKVLNFGDKVLFKGHQSYVFTIEEIDSDGWLWGSDLPEDELYDSYNSSHNFHNPNYCLRVESKPWGNSRIEFRFI